MTVRKCGSASSEELLKNPLLCVSLRASSLSVAMPCEASASSSRAVSYLVRRSSRLVPSLTSDAYDSFRSRRIETES